MAHFTRTRAAWAANTGLLAFEMDDLDGKTAAALNGDQGGVWAPSSIIEIGGAGVSLTTFSSFESIEVTGNAQFDLPVTFLAAADLVLDGGPLTVLGGTASFSGPATFSDTFGVSGVATFSGTASFSANVTIGDTSGDTALFNAQANFQSAVGFNGNVVFNSSVVANAAVQFNANVGLGDAVGDTITFGGSSVFNQIATFNSTALFTTTTTLNGETTVGSLGQLIVNSTGAAEFFSVVNLRGAVSCRSALTFSSNGRIVERYSFGTDTGSSGSPTLYSPVTTQFVSFSGLTDHRYARIDDTNCQDGDHITFLNNSGSFFVHAQTPGALIDQPLQSTSGTICSVTFRRIGGAWVMCERTSLP